MANANNLKFLVCCANGSGSSLMAQMALEKVLKKNNIKAGIRQGVKKKRH